MIKVTALGCGAAYPRAGGACTGYLVEGGGVRIWMDAGNGTLSNLQRHLSYRDVDALVLSHVHADHIADVTPLMYALGFDESVERALPVWAPPSVPSTIRQPLGDMSRELFDRVFEWQMLAGSFAVGDLRLEPFRTVHPVETYGLRVTDGREVLVYTADTADFPGLGDACHGADLLIAEASYVRGLGGARGVHLWAYELGAVAAKAKVRRLALTHIWPTIEPDESVAEAAESYDGEIVVAVEGDVYDVA